VSAVLGFFAHTVPSGRKTNRSAPTMSVSVRLMKKEPGRTEVPMSPTAWQWRSHFVALIEVKLEPKK